MYVKEYINIVGSINEIHIDDFIDLLKEIRKKNKGNTILLNCEDLEGWIHKEETPEEEKKRLEKLLSLAELKYNLSKTNLQEEENSIEKLKKDIKLLNEILNNE